MLLLYIVKFALLRIVLSYFWRLTRTMIFNLFGHKFAVSKVNFYTRSKLLKKNHEHFSKKLKKLKISKKYINNQKSQKNQKITKKIKN